MATENENSTWQTDEIVVPPLSDSGSGARRSVPAHSSAPRGDWLEGLAARAASGARRVNLVARRPKVQRAAILIAIAVTPLISMAFTATPGGRASTQLTTPSAGSTPGAGGSSSTPTPDGARVSFTPLGVDCGAPVRVAKSGVIASMAMVFELEKADGTKMALGFPDADGKSVQPVATLADTLIVSICVDPAAAQRGIRHSVDKRVVTVDPSIIQKLPTFVNDAAGRATFATVPDWRKMGGTHVKEIADYTLESRLRVEAGLRNISNPEDSASSRLLARRQVQAVSAKRIDDSPRARAVLNKIVITRFSEILRGQLKEQGVDPEKTKIVFTDEPPGTLLAGYERGTPDHGLSNAGFYLFGLDLELGQWSKDGETTDPDLPQFEEIHS